MDHWMPEMDGVEVTNRIRALKDEDGYYKDVPIIALTANAITGIQDMFLEKGLNGFLAKPIDVVKLDVALEKWIPKEKQKSTVQNKTNGLPVIKKEQEVPMELFKIKGLNANKAIVSTGGSVDRYLQTLKVFYEDGLEKIKEIKTCLETDNIPLYTIHVHALKSAAANIGAAELSDTAKSLEMAGKQVDMSFIKTNTAQFLTDLESLLSDIYSLPMYSAKGNDKNNSIDTSELKTWFVKLKTAIETLNAKDINNTLDFLVNLKLGDNIGDVVQRISKYILIAEYDEALKLIESLILESK